jgi:MFS-type transporter involved in bile tolerance (Atg22 family)
MVALAFAGLANGVNQALGFAFLTELLPRQRMGELTALSSMTWSFAQPLGSTLAGLMADQTGTLRSTFVMAAVMLLCCLLVLLTVNPNRVSADTAVPAGAGVGGQPG